MSNELMGLYDTRDAADAAAKAFITAGFRSADLKVAQYGASVESAGPNEPTKTPTLLTVTAEDTSERQKAFGILTLTGANLLERKPGRRSSRHSVDTELGLPSAADEDASSGIP